MTESDKQPSPTHYDVFNGDADGIFSLIQLRQHTPLNTTLITGVKRDIALVRQVSPNAGDNVTVLDLSLDKNRQALDHCLKAGAKVFYADHHVCDDIPTHQNLESHIHTDSAICTSLIISRLLKHQYASWAIAGAFGDNMAAPAKALAKSIGLNTTDTRKLRELGELVNYNGYGEEIDDLHFHPADLYQHLAKHPSPLDALNTESVKRLKNGYETDVGNAAKTPSFYESQTIAAYILPNEKWARRISGPFGNLMANQSPEKAHAIITTKKNGHHQISLRAPINNPFHADKIARMFPDGGGRPRAAGINELQADDLDTLVSIMEQTYG